MSPSHVCQCAEWHLWLLSYRHEILQLEVQPCKERTTFAMSERLTSRTLQPYEIRLFAGSVLLYYLQISPLKCVIYVRSDCDAQAGQTSTQMRGINHCGTKLESKIRNREGYFGEPLITQLLVLGGTAELASFLNSTDPQIMVRIKIWHAMKGKMKNGLSDHLFR